MMHLNVNGLASRAKEKLKSQPIVWSTLKHLKEFNLAQAFEGSKQLSISRGCVASANTLGISNRLKSLLSSMLIAQHLDRPLALYWPRNWACRCDFSDLFQNNILQLDSHSFDVIKEHAGHGKYVVVDTWRLLPLASVVPASYRHSFNTLQSSSIDFAYNNIPPLIRAAYLEQVNKLIPTKYIEAEVVSFSRQFKPSTISVSIRSWPDCKERAEGLFCIDNIYRQLDKWPDATFFVSCDSDSVLDMIQQKYKGRVITYPKRTRINDRISSQGMQDILIDMLLLSKSKHLIASCFSTYPEVAWWLGGCKATVDFIENEEAISEWAQEHSHDSTEIVPACIIEKF